MNYDDFLQCVEDAEITLRRADRAVVKFLPLLVGRLKKADDNSWKYEKALRNLKKKLKNFNSVTGKWKED
jgi:hypothetical protein